MSTIVIGYARFVCINFLMRGCDMSKEGEMRNSRSQESSWNPYPGLFSTPDSLDDIIDKIENVARVVVGVYKSALNWSFTQQETHGRDIMSQSKGNDEMKGAVVACHVMDAIGASLSEPQSFEDREEQAVVIQASLGAIGAVMISEAPE